MNLYNNYGKALKKAKSLQKEFENKILKPKTKKQIWKEEYSSINWKDFNENYFKCERCGTYDNQQCICCAR